MIYVGIDDTDVADAPGTNQHARRLVSSLGDEFHCLSNGSGNFFSAGRNYSRSLIRRGLIQFDFLGLPAGAAVVPGTVQLDLEVVDMPKKDTSGADRPFWLVRLDEPWGEGASEANLPGSGAGSGSPAEPGDATWLHTMYDPSIHDPRNPIPSDPGYWALEAALGGSPLDPLALFGAPDGMVPAAPYLGPVVFGSTGMEADINFWLQNPASNFGWIVLGDETVSATDVSSNRGFASRENANPPLLTFEYSAQGPAVPEPASAVLLAAGGTVLLLGRRRRRPR